MRFLLSPRPWIFILLLPAVGVPAFSVPTFGAGTADPAAAKSDPDFAVQGEYVGLDKAMQVVALGDGEFELVIYEGGLPGAGAKPNPRRIDGDADIVEDLIDSMKLQKVVRKSPTLGRSPSVGAVVLFDGTQNSVDQNWQNGKLTQDGLLAEGTRTKQTFQDYQLHLEFRTPWAPTQSGQKRGNSGVYHQARYETQVLDSFGLEGLDNETGGIYTVSAPLVNACFPPLSWQTYDVDFTAARFDANDKKITNARMTVRLNGIIVQNDVEVPTSTRASRMKEGSKPGPIDLQNHGDPVRFRNIWLQPRDADREARRPIVPGFERFVGTESTSLADAGELLMSNLACNACHANLESISMIPDQYGPDLSKVAGRVRHDQLVAMIASPHAAKPGTTMPDPWPGLTELQREDNAAKIASYLILSGEGKIVDRMVSQSMIDRGKNLYQQIGCVACHVDLEGGATPKATSVPLGAVHRKYTVSSLAGFLQNCNEIRPGIRMPALIGNSADAMAIAAYLTGEVTQGENAGVWSRSVYRGKWKKLPDTKDLKAVQADETADLRISDVKPKNNFLAVFEGSITIDSDGDYQFLLTSDDGSRLQIAGQELSHDGIHPSSTKKATFKLNAGIHPIRVEYFDGGGQVDLKLEMVDPLLGKDDISAWLTGAREDSEPIDLLPSEFVAKAELVQEGAELFEQAGCIQCHAFQGRNTNSGRVARVLSAEQAGRGCLASSVKSPAVDYGLGATQTAAIHEALANRKTDPAPIEMSQQVHLTLAALNCYACHVRKSVGGPEPSRDQFFSTTMPEMGWEGRLPPSLDGVGDKLNDKYLVEVINQGANARDYMRTRMPAFDHGKLKSLVSAIVKSDRSDEMAPVATELSQKAVLMNGRKLCGDEGLSCIKCHSFGGNKGGGLGAIDMLLMPERLRPEWFQRYLQAPVKYRPGTRMPNSFVDGRSVIVDINDGSPPLQIDAMWKYLSQGTDAKEPLGLDQKAILLKANERPRIYRNFFADISARGIGVAYPGSVNLLWDAEGMTLSRVWRNEFVDASMHWVGRGQGRQSPRGDAVVKIDSAALVARLASLDSAWPSEAARELGYRFRGYRLDDAGNPVFRYQIGDSVVEDSVVPDAGGFVRTLTIDAKENLVVQLGSGNVQQVKQGFRLNDQVNIQCSGVDFQLLDVGGESCLRAAIPAGRESRIVQRIDW